VYQIPPAAGWDKPNQFWFYDQLSYAMETQGQSVVLGLVSLRSASEIIKTGMITVIREQKNQIATTPYYFLRVIELHSTGFRNDGFI